MSDSQLPRREFLKLLACAFPAAALDWNILPRATRGPKSPDQYDVIVIGSGLGGLSCAAAFARQGFKALLVIGGTDYTRIQAGVLP